MPDLTVTTRRYLTHLLLQRMLAQHDGWDGLLQWLLCGTVRPNTTTRIPYAATPEHLAPIASAEADAWDTARRTAA